MQQKTVLITGASGYIGSEIAKKYVSLGIKPHLLLRSESKKTRLTSILSSCIVYEVNIIDFYKTLEIFQKIVPNIVIHLASVGVYSYTDNSLENAKRMIDSNIQGTLNLLHAARETECDLFLNTGSCFEYGTGETPFKEDDCPNPVNIYGATKIAATELAKTFYRAFKFPVITVRPFTVYGPQEGEGRFITTIIKNCLERKNLKLIKEPVIRDYIFIDDVVRAYVAIIQNYEKLKGEIINISTGNGNSIQKVAEIIIELVKAKDIVIDMGGFPTREGEVFSLVGNPQKINSLIGWKAHYSLQAGIQKTINALSVKI
ncbi:MAG: hypothetical protein A3F31_04375 [Candidatus Levybacteria bacterium RIFCSPHIGHO2_12_FULL_38_12]|nr:MAG: hypothetical protein A3D75_00215 [Candidatus Levybacteria bacterium RIFCSPHIGHO2_02_FULL_37_18]OGH22747.1 MAG: hypothetical protein A3F31_04375 [Candidatus Levybacteria bacterium RIFCSPHIGHO2_12_FULL_38_12]OGH33753.1 MAG: hypothetical protein A3A47_02925 [Candidatus Levybacteria bacterium RIFCSPLOWO2_01_FULL_37_20]OGH44534.1 MAG: hypothetical protein A3J14_05425 [Candidatus Levybacteria bacterium RIFCSPLOWO2_02_FULL_37_18]